MESRIVVIGAGVAGLTAAHRLASERRRVVVLEAADRVGGQLRTLPIDGAPVDVGAESIHLGAPHVAALVRELGLADDAVGGAPGSSLLMTRRGLVPLPAGVGPAGPTRLWPVLSSRIMTVPGLLRAGLEPLIKKRYTEDVSVGAFIRARYGHEVANQFVDPLLGNLHSGDIDQLSLYATAPQLRAKAARGASLTLTRRPRGGAGPKLPMFASWPEGLSRFPDALAAGLDVRLGTRVTGLERGDDGWRLRVDAGGTPDVVDADRIVFAAGAGLVGELLGDRFTPEALAVTQTVPTASVATVVLGYDRAVAARSQRLQNSNGLLLPSAKAVTVKAATNLSRKWAHLSGSTHHLVRASVGRVGSELPGDDEVAERAVAELAGLLGVDADPAFVEVHRWPDALPQLTVGHLDRIALLRGEVDQLPGLALAGGPFDGLGIAATVKSGLAAAGRLAGSEA